MRLNDRDGRTVTDKKQGRRVTDTVTDKREKRA